VTANRHARSVDLKLPDPAAMIRITNALPGNMLERRSFDFFRSRTVVDIAGHFDSSLWSKLVLQAGHSEPAVQHAATALGALHEKFELQRSIERLTSEGQCIDMDFPIRQYTKALEAIRNLLDKSDIRSIELVLISCLMCIYYEALQQNYPAAWTHLEKALKVIKQPLHNSEHWAANKAPYHPFNLIAVDEELTQAFARLDVQASSYLSRRAPRLTTVILPTDIPARFSSLGQSREALNGIIGQLQYFMWSMADNFRYGSPGSIPLPAIAEADILKVLLQTWANSFSAFLNHPSTKMTHRKECGTRILLIQQIVGYIKTLACLYADDSVFDQFDDEFDQILCHAEFLLDNDQRTDPSRVPLCLDMAIIEALFGTAIKCRSHLIRHRAAALLRRVNWREGVWDASMMAKIADRFIAAEEEILDNVRDKEARVPEFWKAHAVGFTIDWKTRHVKLFCNWRLNGMDRKWSEHRDFVTW
jgi:hypothetical protein